MRAQRLAVWGSAAVVAAAIVLGLSIIGSPAEQRQIRLDERRVLDLRGLSGGVNRYWNRQHELPARAEDVIDGQVTTQLPLDPESKQPYEYRVTGSGRYELCATFARRSSAEESNDFWFHEAGPRCFAFDALTNVYSR